MVILTLLTSQQLPSQEWRFNHEAVIRVGRSPDNNVVLAQRVVSRYHLELRKTEPLTSHSAWQLVSLGKNGTFLNGTLVTQSPIVDGSLLQLAVGGPMLKVQVTPEVSPPQSRLFPSTSQQQCDHAGNSPHNLFCIHCGQPLNVERTIHQYQVLRTLGQGGMGTTYLACDRNQSTFAETGSFQRFSLIALKEMNADMAQVAKARELFEREARVLKTLHHPSIPQFFDFFIESGKKYLAMELIHGQNLEQRIDQMGPVAHQQAIAWMLQTCEVLTYIHAQNPPIIHRDIKPANLIVRHRDNRIVVLDFGAVKEIGTPLGTCLGTDGYTAPEQSRGQPLPQSDLYAIGPTLIFLLTGQQPQKFYGKRGQSYRFNLEGIPTICAQLREVIDRVTEPQPQHRYATAQELMQALTYCLP
ncbi:MAG: protein kinase [Leptolyngbyaceae bacterium]|nr:protein kinase [Leptolyngbyaceae bacterium]